MYLQIHPTHFLLDIHISISENAPTRITEFRDFCNNTVPVFDPMAVLCSGDLTEAKSVQHLRANQIEEEWTIYRDAVMNR